MFTNVNLAAPVGAIAVLGAGFLLFIGILLFVYGLISRRLGLARLVLVLAVIGGVIYFGTLLVFSFASREAVLLPGQEKHFCEIDCHLAYSILDTRQTKTLGSAPNQTTAAGTFYVITIKTRFDEKTIGAGRGDGPLTPNSRVVTIVDEQGNCFTPSAAGEQALSELDVRGAPLTTALRPGQSYITRVVFDLPTNVQHPTLLMREGEWLTHFVIGHENSPLHKKTRFQLGV